MYQHFSNEVSKFRYKVAVKDTQDCDSIVPKLKQGSTSANLKRHLKRHHKVVLDEVEGRILTKRDRILLAKFR